MVAAFGEDLVYGWAEAPRPGGAEACGRRFQTGSLKEELADIADGRGALRPAIELGDVLASEQALPDLF